MKLDPLQTQAMWHRIISIVDEAAVGLVRTSYSQVVRNFNDYACGIFDTEGNMLAHSTRTTTLFIGVMPYVMRQFLRVFPADTLKPGDALVTNDPWVGAGHTYDFCVASPIYQGEQLAGFAICIVHHMDVGGRMGTTESRDVYEEGIRLPMVKLYEAGRLSPMGAAIIGANVRAPDKLFGDLNAQLVANHVCEQGLLRMLSDYKAGPQHVRALSGDIRARSERSLRARIAALPDGVFKHALMLPPIGRATDIQLRLSLEIRGDEILIDYAGSSGEIPAAVNVPMNMTRSYSVYAIKLAIDDTAVPNNEGSFRPISVSAPEGSLLNCRPPAPTWGRTMIAHHLPELIFGALEQVIPDRVMAACGSTPLITTRFGTRTRDGRFRFGMNSSMGGMGATARGDGPSCRGFPYNVSNIPIENMENDLPIIYLRKELLPDSGGPGRHRGGLGQVFEIEIADGELGPDSDLLMGVRGSGRKETSVAPVQGRLGGHAGRGDSLTLNGVELEPGPQRLVKPGDRLRMAVPGGGGYGNPLERDVEQAARDVRLGYVSAAAALADYGVDVDDSGMVDLSATLRLRAAGGAKA